MNETDFQNGFILGMSAGGSAIAEVDLPFTEDEKGNVIFEKDIYYNNTKSVKALEASLNKISKDLSNQSTELESHIQDAETFQINVETFKTDTQEELSKLDEDINNIKSTISDENLGQIIDSRILPSDFYQEDPTAKDYIKNKPRIRQDYVILSDTENGYNYAIQMTNGNLITSPMPVGTKVTTLPIKTTYYRGDFLDTEGMAVSVYGEDGSVGTTNKYTSFYLDNPFDRVGKAAVTMVSNLFGTEYKASFAVNVIEFDPEAVLIDFEYTVNDDGTYTITGWKETLNGEPSTELIVPNNSLIRI